MKRNRFFIIGMILNLIPFLVGFLYYDRLPERMAVHIDFNNRANGFASKPVALFVLPVVVILIYSAAYFITNTDPLKKNQSEKVRGIIFLLIPVIHLLMCATIISVNLGKKLDISLFSQFLLGGLFLLLGNYLPKLKRNYTLGIKLPWTIHDDENWEKTHRFAGLLWTIGSVFYFIFVFLLRDYMEIIMPIFISAVVLVPPVYSYLLYRKGGETKEEK